MFSPRRQACRPRPPRGLRLITGHGELSATIGSNVTFMLYLDEVSQEVELKPIASIQIRSKDRSMNDCWKFVLLLGVVLLLLFLSDATNLFLSPSTHIHRQSVPDRFLQDVSVPSTSVPASSHLYD